MYTLPFVAVPRSNPRHDVGSLVRDHLTEVSNACLRQVGQGESYLERYLSTKPHFTGGPRHTGRNANRHSAEDRVAVRELRHK
jgi:hypothetical protein